MKIPILYYHRIFHDSNDRDKYSINETVFRKHIKYLADNGFKAISLYDLISPSVDKDDGKKKIIITLDDGSESDYSKAFPILKEYGFTATFFITVSWIDSPRYVTWSQLQEMAKSGMSIQSHGMTHAFLSDLNSNNLYDELYESKKTLQNKLNRGIDFLSLPGGAYSKKVFKMAQIAGFEGICTSKPGLESLSNSDNKCVVLNRLLITRQTSFTDFKAIVHGDPQKIIASKLKYASTNYLRKIIGNKNYYTVWSKLFKKI